MGSDSSSVTAEREPKRQKRSIRPFSELYPTPSTGSSTSRTVPLTPTAVASTPCSSTTTLSRHVMPSNQAEETIASTPVDPHNLRGIRSKAGLDLLEGDHFRIEAGLRKRWILPKRLLTSHSPYFASIPSEEWAFSLLIGEERAVSLKLCEEEAFELFVQWLYLGELNLDGFDTSSTFLIKAWFLGDKFRCPAFRDHVMVQLINAHRERGIDPSRFRHIFVSAVSGSKLRKWAIDQFHSKLTYGYKGYDDRMDGDHPNDEALWKKYATDLKHFGQEFLGACLNAGPGMNRVKKPWENGQQYMEVLSYAEISMCKEEGRPWKAEATLAKAEPR